MLSQLRCTLLQCTNGGTMTAAAKPEGVDLVVWAIRVRA
jgi:hypothetical protein